MRSATTFYRTGEDRTPSVFVPLAPTRGRPLREYRLRIGSARDVTAARRSGVAVSLLDSPTVTALGYPMTFPPELIAATTVASAIDGPLRVIPFVSEAAVRNPRIEDIALALLHLDPIAARVVLERNRESVDPAYLTKRVLQEDLEAEATHVRFFDLAPTLPRIGPAISAESIARQLRKNRPNVGPFP